MIDHLMCPRSKEGYQVYQQWCDLWTREAKTPPNLKMFFVDQFMSYWVIGLFFIMCVYLVKHSGTGSVHVTSVWQMAATA